MNLLGLVDSSGNTVVSYNYDSWGRMLGINGSMVANLGADNPFRYTRRASKPSVCQCSLHSHSCRGRKQKE